MWPDSSFEEGGTVSDFYASARYEVSPDLSSPAFNYWILL